MKLTGPLGFPPPERCSLALRNALRFTPEPEPSLKIIPSSTYHSKMDSIVSSTERMKQAEDCWGVFGTPILNQTGELKEAFWHNSK